MAKKTKRKRKAIPPHKQVVLPIKTATVDELMVPVVNWLNSFENVQTYSCCEGFDEDELPNEPDEDGIIHCHEPYVGFRCDSMESLIAICQRIEQDERDNEVIASGEVEWHSNANGGLGGLQFTLRFFSKERLREFIESRLRANRHRAKRDRLGFYR